MLRRVRGGVEDLVAKWPPAKNGLTHTVDGANGEKKIATPGNDGLIVQALELTPTDNSRRL